MDETEAAYEALEYICDMADSEMVLRELVDYLSIDDLVGFLHDFIRWGATSIHPIWMMNALRH